ncbi:ATP-dependent RNA helicase ddx24 [Clonorchis sinensis]|uniref:ATP-dependent RNA helicase n=2 Tax=Clonorchis sinensis TaxID=79923 RepID=A0A8T1MH08_CLOSI|nr:ATP-dependent RNA helicase ddx24 [Clonorchis sinensis]
MEVWRNLFVPEDIITALGKLNFTTPTPIQLCVLPSAIRDRSDISGAAPTGSGKTLAFGIPLLVHVRDVKDRESGVAQDNECADSISNPRKKRSRSVSDVLFDASRDENFHDQPRMKPKKRKRFKEVGFTDDVYSHMDFVEELDVDTGEVRALHSLLDDVSEQIAKEDRERFTSSEKPSSSLTNRVYGLVLLPTRELALQVHQHLRALAEFMDRPPRIEVIVGGISLQKQERLLRYNPDILVATPGRLWHFIQQGHPHVCTLRTMNILVVDEADRLLEANHFEDLRQLFNWLNKHTASDPTKQRRKRQTLLFSATLAFVHQGAVKPGARSKQNKRPAAANTLTKQLKLGALRDLLGMSQRAKVFDLSSADELHQTGDSENASGLVLPVGLREMRLLCPDQPSKDIRLFWFLAFGRHHSDMDNQRCLIFLNSKAGVRRLAGVLRQLVSVNAFSVGSRSGMQNVNILHADMMQKQRFRALERFQADRYGILLASDVAARGLDLATMDGSNASGVAWVVHFEVPRTAELYIHRRGRTARANRFGTSLLFVCPEEMPLWRRLAISLKRTDPDLPDLASEPSHFQLVACEKIVSLAKQLDLAEHSAVRRAANEDWFRQVAKEVDIELDSDFEQKDDPDEVCTRKNNKLKSHKRRQIRKQLSGLRNTLSQLVADCRRSLEKKPTLPSSVQCTSKRLIRQQLKKLSKARTMNNGLLSSV